ncbi:Lrp/AsnC family transcriptional regulator [Oxyplasma meridianum]|uniref:Lrp/AsnC family transcriptional regulator n=1 Tax=Oxyplasma meridianum TaxID=3073602 RepID=A0AAX4NGY0_9ARCH
MDQRDWDIIKILKHNSRLSNSEIGRLLNISEGTVRKRISKLVKDKVIKEFTIDLGISDVEGIVLVRIDPRKTSIIQTSLKKNFQDIYEFSGRADLAVRISCNSLDVLNSQVDSIREIDGVKGTDTLIRLK